MPIGQPWQMVAVDILQVPLSTNNNRYLLVLQDYFTKWADAIPLPDQTANRIVKEMVKFFCTYGSPLSIHSDQGSNFESTIFSQVLQAFGVRKSRTTPYHPQGDGMVERFNRTLPPIVTGKYTFPTYCMHIERHVIPQQELPLTYCFMVETHQPFKEKSSLLLILMHIQ